ncbi:DMT family transporter [Pseudoalteromonas ulvae]|uniref:EamA family transporter n=1 Tax=Pseudoalteromonas ulvae TaxID=107327 RepID=A0A244CVC1_PSEDV|nr:DMT family transporter [Pseudoalteromonas ulvae]OUL59504.1 EamA family transporter [Pseudoalteromonas ulvae]
MPVPLAYFAVVLIWSTTPLGIVWSSASVSPTLAVFLRMLIALILGLSILLLSRSIRFPWHKEALKLYSYSSIGIVGGMLLSYFAAGYITSGMMSLMFGLAPIFSGLLAQYVLGEPPFSFMRKIALMLCFIGLGIVCLDNISVNSDSLIGLTLILVAVIFFSLSGVLVKSVQITIHPLATTMGALSLSTPAFFLIWLVFDGQLNIAQWQSKSVWAIIYLGVFGSLLGFLAYFHILQKLSASTVALITLLTPVIAMSLGAWLNNETITLKLIVGATLIMTGLATYQFGEKWRLKKRLN